MMVNFVICILLLVILLLFIGLFKASSVFERILFINSITNIGIVIAAILSSFESNSSYIDIALIYAFLSFLAMVGFLNYYNQNLS